MNHDAAAVDPTELSSMIGVAIEAAGGWLPFDRFMEMALYTPGLGYYANAGRKFGRMPQSGSDFVTAPEMSPLFGRTLALQVAEALQRSGTNEVFEFGAGSGALALQLLEALGERVSRYRVVELSADLRERQQLALAAYADKVEWLSELPPTMRGVVVGNEVLDAMPVRLLVRREGVWRERGVRLANVDADAGEASGPDAGAAPFAWEDRPTDARPPFAIEGEHDYLTEIHPQAEAFIATLAERLERGAAFFIDYGFPEAEYYHPQRHMGTLMCHRGHQADADPLSAVGAKDITAHVNFTGVALAGQEAGLEVLGYCSQARFLLNAGILPLMEQASLAERTMAARLVHEHEMGELFKVLAFAAGGGWEAIGFAEGDRSHTL